VHGRQEKLGWALPKRDIISPNGTFQNTADVQNKLFNVALLSRATLAQLIPSGFNTLTDDRNA